ncbi:DNA-3-methyladenine glycosylase I [Rhodanobacter sp. A1T4]|uniref:DNA-3-methyladenine glycosylase I n=1 Tax=Rhodanobacter sp. A1T4 TaxID=2723087 RepID=UPI00161893F3|nr:DNA-3-methyladenine glycosylase I [Rhodanobacter sp. A1T4]MBB6248207.1 DNA-3-methyladenine glycosylase I [Rhodanobacter sp. A1T4]
MTKAAERQRCPWGATDPLLRDYHDTEWGTPLHDDQQLFEFLCLEGAQAGLSWRTVLAKRDHYRRVFHDFDIARVAAMKDRELEKLLLDPGIIRNRLKVFATRDNAITALSVIAEFGSLDNYLWSFVDGKSLVNRWTESGSVPASTPLSDGMSKAMKKRGFRFVGSTIVYSLMQATGMINDHLLGCFRHKACMAKKT